MSDNDKSLDKWLEVGFELVSKQGFSATPTFMYTCERILSESRYDASFRKLRSSLGMQTVEKTLQALSAKGQRTYAEFQKQMETQLGGIQKHQIQKFTVAFPLPFRFPVFASLKGSDIVDGRAIEVKEYSSFHSSFLEKTDPQKVGLPKDIGQWIGLVQRSRILLLDSYARDDLFAFLEAIPVARQWTALLSYSQTSLIDVSFPPVPFTSIKMPEFGMVFNGDQFVNSYGGAYPVPPLQEGHPGILKIDRFYEFVDIVGKLPQLKIKQVITDALSIYAEAVSESEKNYAFLKFWVGLELMVRLRGKIPDEKVATRMKTMFFLDKPKTFDSQVDTFLSKRNMILHEGDLGAIQWYDIIFAKQLYEEILTQLMRFCNNSLDIGWIESYYDLTGKPVESLEATKNATEFLIKQKSVKP